MTGQNCLRWIFIFGVLSGLFFSSGEGIRLLPFPITEAGYSTNASSAHDKNLKSYAFSIHNSGNHSPSLKSKFQKPDNQFPADKDLNFDWSSIRVKLFLQSLGNREEANFSLAVVFLTSQSDRAPPTI